MNIHILFPLTDDPRGGGNQFLRSLKEEFKKRGIYTDLEEADVVLFNSYQNIKNVVKAKKKYPNKLYVHRVDGPIRLYNTMEDMRDGVTNTTNLYLADATVFQSRFSMRTNYELGLEGSDFSSIIYNGVDTETFYSDKNKKQLSLENKIKLVASSWSSNINKGFDVYEYLDDNLDFNRYEMTFIGNSPIEFKNINKVAPLKTKELSEELRKNDIYISASRNDPCSNSVIEAFSCGLPIVCRNEGGHPELLEKSGNAGMLFEKANEIPDILDRMVDNYEEYRSRICSIDIKDVAEEYLRFFSEILQQRGNNYKKLSFKGQAEISKSLFRWEHNRIAKIFGV